MKPWKWTKKIFFHLLDLTVLNNFIVLASCGSKLSHQLFRWTLVRDLVQEVRRVSQLQTARHERQAPSTSQLEDLTQDTANTCLWEEREFGAMCVPLKTKNQEKNSSVHNATWGLCYHCISEDQITMNWKSGAPKFK